MSKISILDYIVYKLFGILGRIFCLIVPEVYVWLGKIFGRVMFYLDKKHRDIVQRNLRFVFHKEKTPRQIRKIAREAFENFGQNLFESLALGRVDSKYINKYVRIEGRHLIDEALNANKGLIYITLHLGNWELSNAVCGLYHGSSSVIIKTQKHTRLNSLLNSYRKKFGVKIVGLDSLRDIVKALENNEIVTMVSDHGAGKGDIFIDFFGRKAAVPQGAVRLALKFKTPLIFAYIVRTRGPYHRIVLERFDSFFDTGDKEKDLEENLGAINKKFEGYIREHPAQYLWLYKRWKHSKARSILILSDGKAGHLRQSQAVAKIIEDLGFKVETKTIELKYRNKFSRLFLMLCAYLGGGNIIPLYWLESSLSKDSYKKIAESFFDIVISAGTSCVWVNLVVSRQNKAKSIHIMRPGLFSTKRFDLTIIPRHDNPKVRKNIAVTDGALNLIDENYLKEQSEILSKDYVSLKSSTLKIGLLLGGNTKDYKLTKQAVGKIINRIKRISLEVGLEILVTTSRRTPKDVEETVKKELTDFSNCKLKVIANEKNIPGIVAAVLGLCSVIVVTAESISMVSEAVSSGKLVVVVDTSHKTEAIPSGINIRHRRFLENLKEQGYIHLIDADTIGYKIKEILTKRPPVKALCDRMVVAEKIREIL